MIPALVLSAVGTGVSFIGQMQQAKASSAIAERNAQIEAANSRMESEAQQTQASILKSQVEANFRMQQAQAGQQQANADAKREQAFAQEKVNAENIRRTREEGDRLRAGQQAKYTAANIVGSTGSPLSMDAETIGRVMKDIQDQTYFNSLQEQGLFHDAALERLGGQYALAGATLDRAAGISEVGLRKAGAAQTLITGMQRASITRAAGQSQARGYQYGAFGNLLSGGTGLAKNIGSYKKYGTY